MNTVLRIALVIIGVCLLLFGLFLIFITTRSVVKEKDYELLNLLTLYFGFVVLGIYCLMRGFRKNSIPRYDSYVFTRKYLKTNYEIISWWNRGRLLLNSLAVIYTMIHLAICVFIFKNGFIFFLLPAIVAAFIIINFIFSVGLLFELAAVGIFNSKINFDRLAPLIKKWEFILSAYFILTISMVDILNQINP